MKTVKSSSKKFSNIYVIFAGGMIFYVYFSCFFYLQAFTPIPPSAFIALSNKIFDCTTLIYNLSNSCKFVNFALLVAHEFFHYLLILLIFAIIFYNTFRNAKFNFTLKDFAYFALGAALAELFFLPVLMPIFTTGNSNNFQIAASLLHFIEICIFLVVVFILGRSKTT